MLKGKTALITGASRGIGEAMAIEFAKNHANVIVNYYDDKEEADKVVDKIKAYGVNSISVQGDISKYDQVKKMAETIQKEMGKVDILVNNAGIARDRTLKNMSPEEWNAVIGTNLTGVFYVTKEILPLIPENGRIINIASIVALYGNFGQCNYAAAKAGVIGFTKSLSKELGKKKITVNAIAPGFIETKMTSDLPFTRKKIIKYMTTLKELGLPKDIAAAAIYLSSDGARFITGEVINVNGGLAF